VCQLPVDPVSVVLMSLVPLEEDSLRQQSTGCGFAALDPIFEYPPLATVAKGSALLHGPARVLQVQWHQKRAIVAPEERRSRISLYIQTICVTFYFMHC
jgi:hypothetical protein